MNYNGNQNFSYHKFENGSGSITDEVAYRLIGSLAFSSLITRYKLSPNLRVCDVGCYLGGSSARWAMMESSTQVLGTDIHESNIQIASERYQHIENLRFQFMNTGGAIPRIENKLYHLIFATFVLDAIETFEDISLICKNMVEVLEPNGEIYILRLQPNALKSPPVFHDYRIEPRINWEHGDPLTIYINKQEGKPLEIKDRYWEPNQICDVFISLGCKAKLLDLSLQGTPAIQKLLKGFLSDLELAHDMPEWHTPLYQIIQLKK